jgi:hypothetical protein
MNQIYDTYTQDPDETFKMYVERLMKAKPKFGGTFATPQQGQDATSKATGGLLTGLFPEYADRMGGEGGGIDYSNPFGSTSSSSSNPRGNFASAEDVFRAQQFAQDLSGMGRGLGQLGGAVLGPAGMLLGLVPKAAEYSSNRQWDSFNRGIDSDAAARAEAMRLGGMGTYSDPRGNLGTVSNQALIDAYDREMFGTTGDKAASLGGMGIFSDRQGNLGTISNQGLIDAYDREMFGLTGAELSGGGGVDYSSPVGADAPGTDYSGYSAADLGR